MVQILSIPFQKMNNLGHKTLMHTVAKLLLSEKIPTPGCETLIETFNMAIEAEGDAIQVRRKSYITDDMVKMNEYREELYAGMYYHYESSLRHYDASIREAAKDISYIMKSIAYIHNTSNLDRNGYLRKIIYNLCMPNLAPMMDALQMQGWVDALEAANLDYQRLWSDRVTEDVGKGNGNVLSARVVTDKACRELLKRINALITLSDSEEYDHFIRLLNVYIAGEKKSIAIRAGWRRHKKEGKHDAEMEGEQPE